MSPSTSLLKFLLDENVREELFRFLKSEAIEVRRSPKGISNGKITSLSKKNNWILVTNDSDFALYSSAKLFAVIWLRIPQDDVKALLHSFALFLTEFKEEIEGKLIILKKGSWKVFSLGTIKALHLL